MDDVTVQQAPERRTLIVPAGTAIHGVIVGADATLPLPDGYWGASLFLPSGVRPSQILSQLPGRVDRVEGPREHYEIRVHKTLDDGSSLSVYVDGRLAAETV